MIGISFVGMSRNYTKIISDLYAAEAKVISAISAGGSAVAEFEIRGRIVKFKDLAQELLNIRREIKIYENMRDGVNTSRRPRSRARLKYN